MKDFSSENIRNICFMSHGGAGKTTLCESILFNTGLIDRFGKVDDGTSTSDFDPEETKRKISISLSVISCEWKDFKFNILDTPGYFDFVGEVLEGARVADGAVVLMSAKGGVSVGTVKSMEYAKEQGIPAIIFVNKMDEENANFDETMKALTEQFGKYAVPFNLPIMEGGKFIGLIDIMDMKAYKFDGTKQIEIPIPKNLEDKATQIKNQLNELVAETNETLMDKFFSGEAFSHKELEEGIHASIKEGSVIPVFCGSATHSSGIFELLNAIIEFIPSPTEKQIIKGTNFQDNKPLEVKPTTNSPTSALVFKTISDPFVGKISIFKVYSGIVKHDSALLNTTAEKTEKISQLFILRGKKHIPVDKLVAGDIGGIAKLQYTNTNDTLSDQSLGIVLDKITFPEPLISLAIEPKTKGDEEKIAAGLNKLQDEDLTFKVINNLETHQTIISGIGEQHLDIIVSKLKSKFSVSVNLSTPKVAYRETIRKKVKAEGKHKKQSGGHGQYGHVWIEFEPGEKDELTFQEKVFGGAVPKQYFPAVEKGLLESIRKGVLAHYPVVNLKATLVDGSYHTVDSSELAFKLAAHIAYKKGLEQASPVLLEPIINVEVYVPEKYMGDIIGDLNKRRGRILGMNPCKGTIQQVIAQVPQSEMFKYATDLRSMTHGWGYFKTWFERYDEVPSEISHAIIEEAKKHMESEE